MKEEFHYTYSAPSKTERKEIEALRQKYQPQQKTTSDIERLKALDKKVQNPPTAYALILGVVGTMIFGLGLSMILEWAMPIFGTIVALIGIVALAFAYPVYRKTLQKRKNKYGAEILALSEKLLNKPQE